VKLSLAAEEAATIYGTMLDHEYTTKEVFQSNLFRDWQKETTAEERKVVKHLDRCDFTEVHRHFVDKTASQKALSREEKQKRRRNFDKSLAAVILDGHREKIGSFKTEPPGLLKRRVLLEDVVINCSRDYTVPKPLAGPQWKEVGCDFTVMWLAARTENVWNSIRHVTPNPGCDLEKYEVARRLKGVVGEIRSQYRTAWTSPEMRVRQHAVALYFVDKVREGSGHGGCCSLCVEHVQLHPEASGSLDVVDGEALPGGRAFMRTHGAEGEGWALCSGTDWVGARGPSWELRSWLPGVRPRGTHGVWDWLETRQDGVHAHSEGRGGKQGCRGWGHGAVDAPGLPASSDEYDCGRGASCGRAGTGVALAWLGQP
uniref:DNA topoisomerase I eukaryotic-type domain-containing protein n=1 Tax=Moschus moschiferus TaxID=68415 RepID=A0A8C6E3D0_MOSMO